MKEKLVEFEGTVTELLRGGMFRVEIDESKHEIMAQISNSVTVPSNSTSFSFNWSP